MKPIKLKKTTDEHNFLGFDHIEIIDIKLQYTYVYQRLIGDIMRKCTGYVYEYICIADGNLIIIEDSDESLFCYEVRGNNEVN